MKKLLILVDGSSYFYRAFHALPPLRTTQGQPTGAVYGVITMLKKLLKAYPHALIVIVFDTKGPTFRNELYPPYKANRPSMTEDLQQQIKPLFAIIEALGLPLITERGLEADDLIAGLSEEALKQDMQVIISTGDKDFCQLVNKNLTLINTMTNTLLDEFGVFKKFGVKPEQFVDYLSLVGDAVDNIPGVPNVGPKTAAKWLNIYGTLDNLIANASEINSKVGDNLRASLTFLPLAKQLVTIKKTPSREKNLSQLQKMPEDQASLQYWFEQLEFKTWFKEVVFPIPSGQENRPVQKNRKVQYEMITNQDEFLKWLKQLEKADFFSLDTETSSLNYMDAELVGLSFSYVPFHAAYVPLSHNYLGAPEQLSRDWVLTQFRTLLENSKPTKVGHNLKYDLNILAKYGIHIKGIASDTMLESYLLNSAGNRHNMDTTAQLYLDHTTIRFEDIAGKGNKQLTFNQIPVEQATPYAAEDADITLRLHEKLWPLLEATSDLASLLKTIEIPLIYVLSRIERYGVLIDAKLLKQQSKELALRLQTLEEEAYQLAGQVFNLASPKQLNEILFQRLKLPILEKTPKGQPSTSESVLQILALQFPLPKILLEHRSLSKLKTTYTDKLPKLINLNTGRVHTSYHQAAVITGRLSSSDPNLQNIPMRTEEGRKIRRAFIAPMGYKIVAADYSQVELRIMAHLSQDERLLKAFKQGLDIHSATAAEIMGIPLEEVTGDQRRKAKTINFGLVYGMSAFGLARQLGSDRHIAQAYIDRYFAQYPGVKKYMEETRLWAREKGYVVTLDGRRLMLPNINSTNKVLQKASERAAINAPLQGTAADIIKKAMISVNNALQKMKLDAHMIMQVHDELVFEVNEEVLDKTILLVDTHMQTAASLAVPLLVEVRYGNNWEEAH